MDIPRAALAELRVRLLHLHRALLEVARRDYERSHEVSLGPLELLRLVSDDEELRWLRPLSELLLALDDALETPFGYHEADALFARVRSLLGPGEGEPAFRVRYARALQEAPALMMAHAAVLRR